VATSFYLEWIAKNFTAVRANVFALDCENKVIIFPRKIFGERWAVSEPTALRASATSRASTASSHPLLREKRFTCFLNDNIRWSLFEASYLASIVSVSFRELTFQGIQSK
jgi:hypothetical protein